MNLLHQSGIFCIITVLVPDEAVLETLIIFLISKTMISASYLIIYPFAGELYPTQVRGIGIGTSSYIGGLGLIVIPFINYLVNKQPSNVFFSLTQKQSMIECNIFLTGQRKFASSVGCNGFHIGFRWNNWLTFTGDIALSFATNARRGRRIR